MAEGRYKITKKIKDLDISLLVRSRQKIQKLGHIKTIPLIVSIIYS